MSALRKRVHRGEEGITLIELVVVALVLGIVSSVLYNFVDNTTSVTARATSSVAKENDARFVMRELTQNVRAVNKMSTTYPTDGACQSFGSFPADYGKCIRFEVQRSVDATKACPKSVFTYGLVGTTLRRTRTDYAADCATVTSTGTAVVVITGVTNGATPLFEYFNSANQPITPASGSAAYVKAASIRINLWLRYRTSAPDLKLTSAVALRNNR